MGLVCGRPVSDLRDGVERAECSWPPPPGVYLAPPKGYPLVKTGLVVFWLCFGYCLGSGGRACVGLDGWMDWQLSTGCGARRRFQMPPLLADIKCIGRRVTNERTTMSNEEISVLCPSRNYQRWGAASPPIQLIAPYPWGLRRVSGKTKEWVGRGPLAKSLSGCHHAAHTRNNPLSFPTPSI